MLLRALGHGQSAALVRFLKNRGSGEVDILERLGTRMAGGGLGFLPRREGSDAWDDHARAARGAWDQARTILDEIPAPALVVLDEICIALDRGILGREAVEPVLAERRPGVSVVCTGRGAPAWLRDMADTVSEVECRKHAFQAGIAATEGVEL
mgnify:CR=1 FL=1